MTTWFVSRHPGAYEWFQTTGVEVDRVVEHLDPDKVGPQDIVYGVLPLHAIARLCAKGARFFSLNVNLNSSQRGRDLTKYEMDALSCTLQEYKVIQVR